MADGEGVSVGAMPQPQWIWMSQGSPLLALRTGPGSGLVEAAGDW